jgi:hypothetical protein
MAALGRLTAVLGLDSAEFTSALTRAEQKLSDFDKGLERAVVGGLKSFAGQFIAAETAIRAFDAALARAQSQQKFLSDLDDLSEIAGDTVENVSRLAEAIKIGGKDYNILGDAAGKLARGLRGLDEESSTAKETFKRLGIETKDAAGNLRGSAALIEDFAKAIEPYGSSLEKSIIAQQVFGKSGAAMLPVLADIAKYSKDATGATTEQAAAAERLEQAINRKSLAFDKVIRQITIDVTPALTALYTLMLGTSGATDTASNSLNALTKESTLKKFAEESVIGLATLYDAFVSVGNIAKITGASIKLALNEAAAGLEAAVTRNFSGQAAQIAAQERAGLLATIRGTPAFDNTRETLARQEIARQNALNSSAGGGRGSVGSFGFSSNDASLGFAVLPNKNKTQAQAAIKDIREEFNKLVFSLTNDDLGISDSFLKELNLLKAGFDRGLIPSLSEYQKLVDSLYAKQPFAKAQEKAVQDLIKYLDDAEKSYASLLKAERDIVAEIGLEEEALIRLRTAREADAAVQKEKQNRAALGVSFTAETEAGIRATFKDIEATRLAGVERRKYVLAIDDQKKSNQSLLDSVARLYDQEAGALAVVGKTDEERQQYLITLQKQQIIASSLSETQKQEALSLLDQADAMRQMREAAERTADAYKKYEEAQARAAEDGAQWLADMVTGARDFSDEIDNLGKQLLNVFAKKYILQIATGGGFDPSNILNSIFNGKDSPLGAITSLLGGGAGGGAGILGDLFSGNLTGAGSQIGGVLGSIAAYKDGIVGLGSVFANAIPVVGQIGLAIAGAVKIIKSLDGANKPGFRINTGFNKDGKGEGEAFDTPFGRIVFEGTAIEANARAFDQVVAQIRALGEGIKDVFNVSDEVAASISKQINALSDPAFIKWKNGDGSAETEAATKAFLQRYFGTILSGIDAGIDGLDDQLAAQVKGFAGTADELLQFATQALQFQTIIEKLGLDASLFADALQSTEGIQSATALLANYYDIVTTAEDKRELLLKQVTAAFAEFGQVAPTSVAGLRAMFNAATEVGDTKVVNGILAASGAWRELYGTVGDVTSAIVEAGAGSFGGARKGFGQQSFDQFEKDAAAFAALRIALLGDTSAGELAQRAESQRQVAVAWRRLTESSRYFEGKKPEDLLSFLSPEIYSTLNDAQREWLDTAADGLANLKTAAESFQDAAQSVVSVGDLFSVGATAKAEIAALTEQSNAPLLDKLATQIALLGARRDAVDTTRDDYGAGSLIKIGYQSEIDAVSQRLTNLIRLNSKYGNELGDDVLALDEKFALLKSQYSNTATEIAYLTDEYNKQLAAILNVTEATSDFTKAFESIANRIAQSRETAVEKYEALTISDASPQSLIERFNQATGQFNAARGALDAGTPDTVNRFTQIGDERLRIAAETFGRGSAEYARVFNDFSGSLKDFATLDLPVNIPKAIADSGVNTVAAIKDLTDQVRVLREQNAQLAQAQINATIAGSANVVRSLPSAPLLSPVATV